jgi:hypothetical protein
VLSYGEWHLRLLLSTKPSCSMHLKHGYREFCTHSRRVNYAKQLDTLASQSAQLMTVFLSASQMRYMKPHTLQQNQSYPCPRSLATNAQHGCKQHETFCAVTHRSSHAQRSPACAHVSFHKPLGLQVASLTNVAGRGPNPFESSLHLADASWHEENEE